MTNNEVENTKSLLRDAFVKSKNLKGQFKLTKGFDNDKIWTTAAKICLKLNMSPEEMVNVIAKDCNSKNQVMMQYYLIGPKAEKLYREYIQQRELTSITNLDDYISKSIKFAEVLLHSQKDSSYVIYSPSNAIEPWLRIYLSKSMPNRQDIIEMWKEPALKQLDSIQGLRSKLKERKIELDI